MQARAGAVDELIASGALSDHVSGGKDDITRELEQMAATGDVEAELAKMKAQLGGGSCSRRRSRARAPRRHRRSKA